jgi:hypothetical protein
VTVSLFLMWGTQDLLGLLDTNVSTSYASKHLSKIPCKADVTFNLRLPLQIPRAPSRVGFSHAARVGDGFSVSHVGYTRLTRTP